MANPFNEMNNAILVIGGGIAGIQSSLDLAELGFKVYLVEKRPSIGGVMAQLDRLYQKNASTMENSLYKLTPKMGAVLEHPNIEILTYSEVTNVDGSTGDFTVTILQHPRFVDDTKCDACDTCATVCPVVIIDDEFEVGLGKRKAAYTPYTQAVPKTYVIDKDICLYFNNEMCRSCQQLCPKGAVDFDQEPIERKLDVNAIIVATGTQKYDSSVLTEFGYDFENVMTALEFERMLSTLGPTQGHIFRLSDRKTPETIAFVTLNSSTLQKASAIKQSISAKEQNPIIECMVFMEDVLDKKQFDELIQRSLIDNISYVEGQVSKVEEDSDTKDIILHYNEKGSKESKDIKVDMVVLFDQLIPSEDTTQLASTLGLKLDNRRFFVKKSKVEVIETKKPGIFAIGTGRYPEEDISSAIADAKTAVSRIVSLAPLEIRIPVPKAYVETEHCIGCGYCREVCPYYAISLEVVELKLPVAEVAGIPLKTRKAQVHEGLCRGCGQCVPVCPVQAINYEDDAETIEEVFAAMFE